MGKTRRRINVQPQRRQKPDYRKISAALQAYLAAQAEVDAESPASGSHGVSGRSGQSGWRPRRPA